MSDPTDIKALDEYLKGGSDVSQRYRELGRDEVPPELDRRVLAAARDAVADEGTKRSRSWLRWSAPVALAASVVLGVTVVLESGVEKETAVVTQAPAEAPQVSYMMRDKAANEAAEAKRADEVTRQPEIVQVVPVGVEPPAALRADVPSPAPAVADVRQFRELVPPPKVEVEQHAGAVATVAPAVAPPPAEAPVEQIAARKAADRSEVEADSSLSEAAVSGGRTRRPTGRAGPRGTISPNGLSSESRAASEEQREPSDPQEWLEDIRELRRAGKTVEADREWQRFREAFPEFSVAEDDLARKKP